MAGRQTAVLGIYPDYASVEKAVDVLKQAGFRNIVWGVSTWPAR